MMLTDKRNILQTIALMIEHGVEDIVVCPGSRNAPITHTLNEIAQSKPEQNLRLHSLTDERSAGFFAIGLALATKRPTAIVVTSGSALVNLHPAVSEAFYQQVPLIVISADRPEAWIGQMDGQTMPQAGVFGCMSKKSITLPEVHTEDESWYCNRILNEALLECTHHTCCPVHINIPISEPLYEFNTDSLPNERIIERIEGLYPTQLRRLSDLLQQTERRMIIIGQKTDDRQLRVGYLKELRKGYVALCEHLSNCGEGNEAILLNNALMQEIEKEPETYHPDIVITVGGHILNKRLKQYLRTHTPKQHWHISADGSIADTFCCLTTVVEADPYTFLQALAYLTIPMEENNAYVNTFRCLQGTTPSTCKDSASAIVGRMMNMIPEKAVLHLANSSSVRYAQEYPLRDDVTVCCNRGINGIEGCLSSAVGFATATPNRHNYVVIGDLAFFYDQNALWNTSLPQNLHILLINDGGGKIFETLPLPQNEESRRLIQGKHHTSAQSIASQYGIRYINGAEALADFIQATDCILLEINL